MTALLGQEAVGVALLDREYRYVRINAALARLNGATPEEHRGRTVADVLPPDTAGRIVELVDEVLAGRPVVDFEISAPDAEGVERLFVISYLPVIAEEGIVGVLGLVSDRTARRRAEAQLEAARHRLYLTLEGTGTGTFEFEAATGRVRWSENMGPLYGRPRGWSPGTYDEYVGTVHPDDREPLGADVRRAIAEGGGYEREFRALMPDGGWAWRQSQVHALKGADGTTHTLVGLVQDIEARKRRERRTEYLSQATLALSQSLDADATLQRLADLAVPELGDWCAVVLQPAPGTFDILTVAHREPEKVRLARTLQERYPPDPDAPTGTPAVMRTGRSELYPAITDDLLVAAARDPDHLQLMRELNLGSLMTVPLVARGRTLGAMTFAYGRNRPPYGQADLELAEDLGRRAGLALDNARLYETVRSTAVTLQRSLLPGDLPPVEGWDVAARYLPGEAGAAVGGDWYDAFFLPEGTVALVVGDVMGRGIPAATGMSRLRSALQAQLFETGDPAAAAERLDDLVSALRIVPFATLLAVVLDPATGAVRICTAGHPPPLLQGPDTGFLPVSTGPPVGARLGPRQVSAGTVGFGQTLMLYTDGLVEARESPLDRRLELLRQTAGTGATSADELVDRAIEGMLGRTPPDDVAVLAVRRRPRG